MSKFGRVYSLDVELADGQKTTLTLPFTVEFTVRRESLAASQTATITVYNLGERLRNLIYKDRFDTTVFRAVQLRAGYESFKAPLIFNGVIRNAYSERRGVDFITVIEAYDGGYSMANSYSSMALGAGITRSDVLKKLNDDLKGMTGQPIIGNFPQKTARGSVYLGNTWDLIFQVSSGYATIDNGQLKVLNPEEAIESEIPVITAESGLLGSPLRSQSLLEFEMLFEPRFTLLQVVALQSSTNAIFNGIYKVMGFTHTGIISPSVSGDCRTSVSLWIGEKPIRVIQGVPAVVQ